MNAAEVPITGSRNAGKTTLAEEAEIKSRLSFSY